MNILKHLTNFPHRGATTKEEKQAAEYLQKHLSDMGVSSEIESFKASSSYSWEVILFSVTMIAGLIISPWLSKLGTAIVLLGFWSYVRHFMGQSTIFTPFIPKRPSQNIIGQINSSQDNAKTVVLMAHYDSARASSVFAPNMVRNFRQSFLLNTYVGVVSIIWAYLGEFWGVTIWFKIVCLGLAAVHLINVIIHVLREIFHKFVPGANDNASGVATIFGVIEKIKAQPLANTNLKIVFTACEEAGIQGAKAFYHKHWPDLPVETTKIINIDNVGSGNLHYVTGEGMLLFYNFDSAMIDICRKSVEKPEYKGIHPLEYRRAYFDTLVFAQHGYPCTTLIALDNDGIIPNWHWYTDNLENIDAKTIRLTIDFTDDLVRMIDQQ